MILSTSPKTVSWSAPSNIALVKYWGKRPVQLPGNASLSLTLNSSRTRVDATYKQVEKGQANFDFSFEGKAMPAFALKVEKWLKAMGEQYPILKQLDLSVNSSNTFPHSAGIASSASSMAAMALVVSELIGLDKGDEAQWLRQTSSLS